jgi:asparagine synthase (glutamine-hydrolysing)
MCGIAGVVAVDQDPAGREAAVGRMLETQVHRGPEGRSTASLSRATFGLCKLGFVDIARSRQPSFSPDGRIMVVFNGELYEHARLRADLERRLGAIAPGEAALLAALYAEEGADMVERLTGMFAIACYDRDRDEVVLLRDRFGKKPLSYLVHGGGVAFASELRALRRAPGAPSAVDPRSLALFLTFGAVPAPASLLDGVRKVPPGAMVAIRAGHVRTTEYWSPRLGPRAAASSPPPEELEHLLLGAIGRRLAAEAPVGLFVSGGLDSGLVAALASRLARAPLTSFSLGFPDAPRFDETSHARMLAAHLGLNHRVVQCTRAAMAREAIAVLTQLDEPLADQSLVPTVHLARAARSAVKAVLTGDGADELFMGYRIFEASRALDAVTRLVPGRWMAGARPARSRTWPPVTSPRCSRARSARRPSCAITGRPPRSRRRSGATSSSRTPRARPAIWTPSPR